MLPHPLQRMRGVGKDGQVRAGGIHIVLPPEGYCQGLCLVIFLVVLVVVPEISQMVSTSLGHGALVAVGLDGGQQRLHQLRRDLVFMQSHVSDVHGGDILRVKAILIAVP